MNGENMGGWGGEGPAWPHRGQEWPAWPHRGKTGLRGHTGMGCMATQGSRMAYMATQGATMTFMATQGARMACMATQAEAWDHWTRARENWTKGPMARDHWFLLSFSHNASESLRLLKSGRVIACGTQRCNLSRSVPKIDELNMGGSLEQFQ